MLRQLQNHVRRIVQLCAVPTFGNLQCILSANFIGKDFIAKEKDII